MSIPLCPVSDQQVCNRNTRIRESVRSVQTWLPLRLVRLSISPLRLALPISRSLSCPLAAVDPCVATVASFLHLSRPCCLLPQSAKCLPVLFPSSAQLGCVAAAPTNGGSAQVLGRVRSSRTEPRVTHERGRCWWCSHATGSHPDGQNQPASFSPPIL
jgi:hypothetical protein